MHEIFLTKKGYQKLAEDLQHLKTVKRRQYSKAIGEAKAHGDLSENAEYDAAKEAQELNEKRIAELESKIAGARIIDDEDIPADRVLIGATVKLKDLEAQKDLEYTLVAEVEADFSQGKISVTSPLGQGLLNRKEGEVAEIKVPAGLLRYKVLKISRGQ